MPNASHHTARPRAELPTPVLAACQQRVAALWGLHFPPERWHDLTRHLHLVATELELSLARCVEALLQEPVPPALAARCVREFTVGETYFLRDADFFERLRQDVLVPLIARRRAVQDLRLRFWSAGCCSGEEAYGLAILLEELLPDQEHWQIQIMASDLNPAFLAAAQRGQFGNWSFRKVSADWRQQHFVEQDNGRWRIHDRHRRHIRFLEQNLASADYPAPAQGLAHCDLILCRNVLMYFTPDQAVAALTRLRDCLATDGLLFLASAEGALCQWANLMPELWPGALCLRRQAVPRQSISTAVTISSTISAPAPSPVFSPRLTPTPDIPAEPVHAVSLHAPPPDPSLKQKARVAADEARVHANRHQLQAALDWTGHALTLDKLDPRHYWLLASLHIENGDPVQARATLRKAIYLQPDFIMAHYLCGLLNARLGEPNAARRDWNNSLRLLEALADDHVLPEGDGLSARDLTILIRQASTREDERQSR